MADPPDPASVPPASVLPASVSHEPIAKSAGRAGAATLVSRALGVARETVQAAYFGAGNEMDAYLVAFRIPNLVRDLFAEGAMSAALVPTFTRHLARQGREAAMRLGSNVMSALLAVTGVIVVAGWIFTTPLVTAYAGDFAQVPGKIELTVHLARIMLPFLTLVALAAAAMGMLNALGHFFVPALSPAAFNVASILSALALTPLMPALGQPPITALAIGALLGGVGQLALQWPVLRREGFRWVPRIAPADPGLRHMLLLMGPGTLGLAATQVNLFVSTLLAAREGPGAVSWLQYAFRLIYLPIGLFGVSIATAVLPAVSRHVAIDNAAAISRTVTRGVGLMLLVNIPATIGLVELSAPIVRLLLERGRFLPTDTLATAAAVQCYAVGLVGYSAARIASPVFYAIGRSRVAVMLSTVSITVNLIMSLALTPHFGFLGLALATSLAAVTNGTLALVLLHRQYSALDLRHLAGTALKTIAATALMVAALRLGEPAIALGLPGDGLVMQIVRLLAAIAGGVAVFAAAAAGLRISELDALAGLILRRAPPQDR